MEKSKFIWNSLRHPLRCLSKDIPLEKIAYVDEMGMRCGASECLGKFVDESISAAALLLLR